MKRCICGKRIPFDAKKCPCCGLRFTTGKVFEGLPLDNNAMVPDYEKDKNIFKGPRI